MNQAKFHSWMLDELVWWRWDANNPDLDLVCSKGLLNLFEHSVHTIKNLTGIYHSPVIALKLNEALQFPDKGVRFIASYETKNGKFSYQHALRVYKEGKHCWVIAECIDVTEMVELEREIVDAQGRATLAQVYERQALLENQNTIIQASYEKQSRFLALLSHELRSPLLGMKSMLNVLKEQFADNEFLVDRLRVMNLTTEQMTFLVNDILTYSQTEYDAITLHPKRFSLKQTFDYVKQLTDSIAKDKGVFVSLIYTGDKNWVYGDSVRLAQILINLIANGIKFTHYGGVSVEVTELSGDQFHFKVTDSGEGILAEKLTQIFDPFVQFKTKGSTTSMGSGLGLSVVKQLIDIMGGDITVSSKVGIGTTFNFNLHLPSVAIEVGAEPEESVIVDSVVEKLKESHYRVLVVDDSKINRMVLLGFLRAVGCQVEEAVDGQQAWKLIQEKEFDFIFLDIQMPVMDGFEVIKLINEKRKSGGMVSLKSVFAITAGGGEELIPQGQTLQSLGFEKWFVKPISQRQVINILSESPEKPTPKPLEAPLEKPSTEALNESLFESEVNAIPKQFESLLDAFVHELERNIQQMNVFLETKQWDELKAKAHFVKGNCMVFQLDRWVGWLRIIEHSITEQNDVNSPIETQKIIEMINNLEKALKYLENSKGISDNKLIS